MSFEVGASIIEQLNKHGYEAYFVGGAVRDTLLGRAVDDIDIATAAPPEKVVEIFPKTIPVGIEHGTVIVRMEHQSFEVTTFRREGKYEDYRHPSSVDFITSITEDLMRRDFTINAMALTSDGQLIDPFHGQVDIEKKVIRTVGSPDERFMEDPLRMMRGIRFLSMLNFNLEDATKESIIKNKAYLKNIAIERITVEFEKMLKGKAYTRGIQELIHTELYNYLPGLNKNEGLVHFSKLVIPAECTIEERWTLLCYMCEIDEPVAFLKGWKLPNSKIRKITQLLLLLKNIHVSVDAWFVYKEGLDNTLAYIRLQNILDEGNRNPSDVISLFEELPIKERKDLQVNGNDLIAWSGEKPGPWIEALLLEIEKTIVTSQLKNDQATIREWVIWRNRLEVD